MDQVDVVREKVLVEGRTQRMILPASQSHAIK
jgi:hypothetical protein